MRLPFPDPAPIGARALAISLLALACTRPAHAQWSLETLPTPRVGLAATAVGDLALFAGGHCVDGLGATIWYDVVEIWDAGSDTWSSAQLSQARSLLAATTVGDRALFAGGIKKRGKTSSTASARVDIYDHVSGVWGTALLSQPRTRIAATYAGNKALFAGGGTGSGVSAAVDIYDWPTSTWTTASLSEARSDLCAATVGDRALFAGGRALSPGGGTKYTDAVDIYDAATGAWSTAKLSVGRALTAATTIGDRVFFAGGWHQGLPSDVVDIYDSTTDSWSTTKLSEARSILSAFTLGDRAFFVGGECSCGGGLTSRVDVYDAAIDAWTTDEMEFPRYGAASTTVGRHALIGGGTFKVDGVDVVNVYGPSLGGSYCGPAVPNSTGAPAVVNAWGSDAVPDNDLSLRTTHLPTKVFGYFMASPNQGFVAGPGGSQGDLCLGGPITRLVKQIQNSGDLGEFQIQVDLVKLGVQVGETWNFQAWFRDTNPGPTSNFTHGVSVTFK